MRRSGQSASEYSLSLKKPPTVNKKNYSDHPKSWSQKVESVIAFRIAVTLEWFGRQVAVCVNQRHTNENFWLGRLQKFNFDCLLLKLLICLSRTEKNIKLSFSFADWHVFRDSNIFHPIFEIKFLQPSHHTHVPPCVPQQGSHYQIQGQTNFQPVNIENCNNNFLFWLRVWLSGGLAETSLNQLEQKSFKIIHHRNWNGSPKTGK